MELMDFKIYTAAHKIYGLLRASHCEHIATYKFNDHKKIVEERLPSSYVHITHWNCSSLVWIGSGKAGGKACIFRHI